MRAILFDMDGVLYEGERAIAGAAEVIDWVHTKAIPHLFLTNTTSRPREALVIKLGTMGIEVEADEILTPPVAACRYLETLNPGPLALFVPQATAAEFTGLPLAGDDAESAGAVVLGDLGEGWDFATLNRAFRLLMLQPTPTLIALGLTRYWRAEDGLRLDVGPFVRGLEYASGCEAVVMGKPATAFFQAALHTLGVEADEAVMIGDDIRGDIEGGQRAGLHSLLVRTGKFRPQDLKLGITPDAVLDSIRELPDWWKGQA